jgi:glutathione S-transferase
MKLHWSPRSPYVRKVLIVAHEKGVADRIDKVRTRVGAFDANEVILVDNPIGKVPTLMLDNGEALYDSPVICEYLDGLSPKNPLLPAPGPERIATLRRQALGDGLMDLLNGWRVDTMKPDAPPSAVIAKASATKFWNAVGMLERSIESRDGQPVDLGDLAIACAFCYADFRFTDLDWRKDHPRLAAWHAKISERPSLVATVFVDA